MRILIMHLLRANAFISVPWPTSTDVTSSPSFQNLSSTLISVERTGPHSRKAAKTVSLESSFICCNNVQGISDRGGVLLKVE